MDKSQHVKVIQIPGLPEDVGFQPLDIKFSVVIGDQSNGVRHYRFDVDDHVKALIRNLRSLWEVKHLTDTMLLSEEKQAFHFHSVMLAACSPIFRDTLSQAHLQFFRGTLAPKNVTSWMLKALQTFLYYPEQVVVADGRERDELMKFAMHFQIDDLTVDGLLNRSKFLENLAFLYGSRSLTFGILKAGEVEFPCHFPIVACVIPSLRQLSKPNEGGLGAYGNIPFEGVPLEAMKCILNFIYNAQIVLDEGIVLEVLRAATNLQVISVSKACVDFMKATVTTTNVVDYFKCANEVLSSKEKFAVELYSTMVEHIIQYFSLLMRDELFLSISSESEMITFLSRAELNDIAFEDLIDMLYNWATIKPERKPYMSGMMALVGLIKSPRHIAEVLAISAKYRKLPSFELLMPKRK